MRLFYIFQKGQPVADLSLTWSHYLELLPLKDINKINYYMELCIKYNLSRNKLREKIKSKEYERLSDDAKLKLITNTKLEIKDLVKNPRVIRNSSIKKIYSEYALKQLILEDLPYFLEELGEGFAFINQEYKIKIGTTYNYIDLLLYNIKFNCYVVVELKVTELKKEHIGQIQVYMNYIDNNLKDINQNKTIGIIICKKNNKYVLAYTSDERIISREYIVI